ncbi:hypothetical protein [Pontibacter chitinilyticus]|uniref:hypothetical protein n=1 Tax=Pontibacter chitinilyticus TaxID=2674989 RepID=UPI00321A78D7
MKNKQPSKAVRLYTFLLIIGLLTATVAPFISRRFEIPDFFVGSIVGIGIGIELLAAVQLFRFKRSQRHCA